MKRGEFVLELSTKVVRWLSPLSKKIEIVGSIRREKENPGDIDIVLIPRNKRKLKNFLMTKGKFIQGGQHESTWKIQGIQVELYYAENLDEWGSMLLAYSGKKGSNIGLRVIARSKGFKLTQHGLFNRKTGKYIAGKTEKEIYEALKRPYKEPWER